MQRASDSAHTVFRVLNRGLIMREPRPCPSSHASTIVWLPDGTALAAWFMGTAEKNPDVDIWGARWSGAAWSEPFLLAGESGIAHWNPVLYYDAVTSRLHLYYKVGHTIPEWQTLTTVSDDGGFTWSMPRPLVEGDRSGGRGPVRNKPIALSDGTWLAPASVEDEYWDAFVDISLDQGATWTKSRYVPVPHPSPRMQEIPGYRPPPNGGSGFSGKGVIQPTLWESSPGIVHMLLRTSEGRIYRSDSTDSGWTWSPAYATNLPNNNSGIDLTRLGNGWLVLACNPVSGNWSARTPLVLLVSRDGGINWGERFVLEQEPGEYSYPAIISHDNEILVTYTWNRENIAFWKLGICGY